MSRQKGSPKTGGRKKGTPNKDNKVVKELFAQFCPDYLNSDLFKEDWQQLSAKDRVMAVLKMSEWLVAKPQSHDININSEGRTTLEDELIKEAQLYEQST